MTKRVSARRKTVEDVKAQAPKVPPDTDAPARARAEQLARICERIRGGSSVDAACWREGLNPDTLRSRCRANPEELALVEAARAEAEDARREQLRELVASGMPTAGATWMLERLHRGQYHLPSKVHLGGDEEAGPVATTIKITLAEATEAAREREGER
jgi:hypothetical protein